MSGWRLPVLTYHAANVAGGDYLGNDHVALAADLAMFARAGWRIVPARWAAEQVACLADRDLRRCVALTCDDGTDLDLRDLDWPGVGRQRSFAGILAEAAGRFPALTPHLTSFVIADPQARAVMDRDCLHGRDWMREWWAEAGPHIEIGCHSWDHNHPALGTTGLDGMPRGDFFVVDNEARADFQIAQALDYIGARIAPARCALFAYPYGHANAFLREDWLPRRGPELGLLGAFGCQGEPAHAGSDRWELPRFVCGWHWKSAEELWALLASCA
ncbi:polysaccharide deacetylase family protein [Arenimonas composti]|uniref:Uncharacterized protein n=1 Tax=Arenimonas composti TR7-09 = DSM 18010 TaxID=1121013 RepID=A0A091C2I6_9GAMM|nr:polysaccharide deacetylase family protein [Arenimonas composti]KFN50840.1 hypothetical protein P873_00400 [Arenimonas composti TR7-09 = DSM 18010]